MDWVEVFGFLGAGILLGQELRKRLRKDGSREGLVFLAGSLFVTAGAANLDGVNQTVWAVFAAWLGLLGAVFAGWALDTKDEDPKGLSD